MSKVLVAYFSASGYTEAKAKLIAESAGADIFEIKPAQPYTAEDLDWHNKQSRSSLEMADLSFRPPMAEEAPDISGYDTIFVGFPIWWYKAPTIINTFLESRDFSGKTIILFATSGGSRFGDTVKYLKDSVSDTAVLKEGRILTSAQGYVISAWLKELGIITE